MLGKKGQGNLLHVFEEAANTVMDYGEGKVRKAKGNGRSFGKLSADSAGGGRVLG
jgi:hypothetical protein